jgi:stage V sporulation protein R
MKLISQHVKAIMEECKLRARDTGLSFSDETLEYIVTNQDMLELSPKMMIPTIYDYWVHDVKVLQEKGKYKLYPSNPYETVINTRPAVSFYNDNNPDWLNVMIFYHVLGHIDFFQNNIFFKHTWGDDFMGRARADKRLIARLRSEYGRWVDYIIEFARGADNILGYYKLLSALNISPAARFSRQMNYYFDCFLQNVKEVSHNEYLKNLDRYNELKRSSPELGESLFFSEVKTRYPEFDSLLEKDIQMANTKPKDVLEWILENSPFLRKDENSWMKSVIHVVRDTALYFDPQRRDHIFNEGWASYWHERMFLKDSRIKGHEVDFARVHAKVTALPSVGLNPYAIGMRLTEWIGDLAEKGRISYEYEKLQKIEDRDNYNLKTGRGTDFLFKLREEYCDFTLINQFLDQDFVNRYKLFTVEKRLNTDRQTWEYFIKSRDAKEYRQMLLDNLWHPPDIAVDEEKTDDSSIYLVHREEGKPLVQEYITNTMIGLEYLWGNEVKLETTEIYYEKQAEKVKLAKTRVCYRMKNRKLSRTEL